GRVAPARHRVMKIPYGTCNFGTIRSEGFFYVDKTPFLPVLESAESGYRHLLFLRPRRFGKSTLVSLLSHYYDIDNKERFDELFKGLWIHEHPTPELGRYLVLAFDFSGMKVADDADMLAESFGNTARASIRAFCEQYGARIPQLAAVSERLDGYRDAGS